MNEGEDKVQKESWNKGGKEGHKNGNDERYNCDKYELMKGERRKKKSRMEVTNAGEKEGRNEGMKEGWKKGGKEGREERKKRR